MAAVGAAASAPAHGMGLRTAVRQVSQLLAHGLGGKALGAAARTCFAVHLSSQHQGAVVGAAA